MGFLLIIIPLPSFGIVSIREIFTPGRFTRTICEPPLVVFNAAHLLPRQADS